MPRLRLLTSTTCPCCGCTPGQVVEASPALAQRLLAEGHAELVRDRPIERAEESWRRT